MALIKVSDVAKKAEISVEEVVNRLNEAGISVSSADDSVNEDDVSPFFGDSKHQQLDRRQEMLKKALERHKRGVKIKEVLVTRGGNEPQQTRKLSKEDLMKKRSELDLRLKKVDEDRETIIKERTDIPVADKVTPLSEQKTPEENITITPPEPKVVPEPVQVSESPKQEKAPVKQERPATSQFVRKPQDQSARPPYQPRQNYTERPQGQTRTDSDQQRRPYTPRTDRPERTGSPRSDGTNFARPYTPRTAGQGPIQGQADTSSRSSAPYNRNDRGDRPVGDRPYQQRTQGQRPPYDKSQSYNRTGSPMGSPRFTSDSPLTFGNEEERKRLIKKKEDEPTKEKDAKKPKTKKDVKRPKSWVKTINEGIDELNIEHEIEHKPTISPNIDISDLVDVDPDKQKFRQGSGGRNNYDKRSRRRHDSSKNAPQKAFVRPERVEIGERVVIADFGSLIGIKATELIKKLFGMGIMATVNQSLEAETAQLLGMDYGVEVVVKTITEDDLLPQHDDKDEDVARRPPIVTVMGHVDHGKTSLLDAIRSTSVASGEEGGITQHIGAYEVDSASGKIIFLDTPGHEAFTTLRARGALLTDIVILVVAADDGVKPQTREAIDHAKAAGVRIVVAINKIDKDGANPDKVRQQLAEYGIISDAWGGEFQFQEISAKKRIGIDDLLERVLLEAEVLDLKGNADREADGVVIESRLDKQKGPVATILVKNGALHKGDTFISGSQFGKVRAMFNFKGASIKEAGLSIPVEVMGFSEVPEAGERFIVVDEKTAKQVAELRANAERVKQQAERGKLSLADFFGKVKEGELKELNIILKTDAQGSLEALTTSLKKLSNQEVKVNIIHGGLGAITESDVALASASNAIMIGFNVRPDNNARQAAEREKVSIELYSVIYKAIDDVKLALEGLLSPEMKENQLGRVEVRQVFSVPKIGKIAGCMVLEGKVTRNSLVRVIRDSVVVFDGKISSLKRFTDDAKEVTVGFECGLSIDRFQDIKEKDVLEVYEVVEEKRTLEDVAKLEQEKKEENKKEENK